MGRTTYGGATAIVTGGGSGIGRALGVALVARGATVVLADVDGDAASAAAAPLGDAARARVLDAVARNRRVICIPRSTGALWRLSVLSPGAFDRLTRSLAATVRRELDARAGESP